MSLPSSMVDFVPCDRLLQKAYSSNHKFGTPVVLLKLSVTCDQSNQGYVVFRSFHFHDLRVDEALRSFLESFRLPGESPVIEHIMEFFSKQFYVSGATFT